MFFAWRLVLSIHLSHFHLPCDKKKTFFETLLQYLAKKVGHNNHSLVTRASVLTLLDPEPSSPHGWLDLFLTCGQKKRNKWISKIWIPHNQSYQKCLWSKFRQLFFCPSCVFTTSNYLAEEASRIGLYDEVSLKWSAMIEYGRKHSRGFYQSQGDNFSYVVIRTPPCQKFNHRRICHTKQGQNGWSSLLLASCFWVSWARRSCECIISLSCLVGICISRNQINCQKECNIEMFRYVISHTECGLT